MKDVILKAWNSLEKAGRKITDFLLGLIGKSITDEQWSVFMQFIKFGLVGAVNTVVDYATYLLTLLVFMRTGLFADKAYMVSTMLGFIVSFFNMFYWNNRYVFKKKDGEHRSIVMSFIKLFLTYSVTGVIIRPLCLYLLVDAAGLSSAIAPIPIMLITIPFNFIFSKLWAFKGKKQ